MIEEFAPIKPNVNLAFPDSNGPTFFTGTTSGQLQTREESLKDLLTYGVQSALVGFVDTVGTSVGLLDENQLSTTIKQYLPEFGTYYERNKEAAQLVGDLVGMFIPGMLAIKAIRGGGILFNAMNKSGKLNLLSPIFTSGKTNNQLLRGVQYRDRFLARRNIEPALDTIRKRFSNRAQLTRVSDTLKEVAAFELGLLATMHDSQTLYPDELTSMEILGINALVTLPIIGIEAAFITRQMRASAQHAKSLGLGKRISDPEDVLEELVERPGNRDISLTAEARTLNILQSLDEYYLQLSRETAAGPGSYASIREQIGRNIAVLEADIKKTSTDIFKDVILLKFTNRSEPSLAELASVREALKRNEAALIGTFSLDHMFPDVKTFREILSNQETSVEKLQKDIEKALKIINEPGPIELEKVIKAEKTLRAKRKELDIIASTEFYVIEPTGNLINAKLRKPIYQDGVIAIKKTPRTQTTSAIYEVNTRGDKLFELDDKLLGITENFHVIIPSEKVLKISGVNATKILKPDELERVIANKDYSLILKDIGEDWHFKNGHRGRDVFINLPKDIQTEIRGWIGNSASSALRKWAKEGDERFSQIINAYKEAGLHKRLLEVADDDGTIILYRGEAAYKGDKQPSQDIVSYTSSPRVAKQFGPVSAGKQVINKRVHVDDVIMVVGGAGNEAEFIVKNNKLRSIGEQVTKKNWTALTLQERSAAYAGLQRAVNNFKLNQFSGERVHISTADHHTRIDSFLTLYQKHGDDLYQNDFVISHGASIEDLIFASMDRKFEDFMHLRKLQDATKQGFIKFPESAHINFEDVRKMTNLPENFDNGSSPILEFYEEIYKSGDVTLSDAIKDFVDLKRAIKESAAFPDMALANAEGGLRHMGEMISYPLERKPVLAYKHPTTSGAFDNKYVQEGLQTLRQNALDMFAASGKKEAHFVQSIYDTIISRPELLEEAITVSTLTQAGVRGKGILVQQAFSAGEQPAFQAMHQLAILVDKQHRINVGLMFKQHEQIFQALKKSKSDMASLSLGIHARRMAWDIEKAQGLKDSNELTGFILRETNSNRKKWKQLYGEDMPENAFMPTATKPDRKTGLQVPIPLGMTPMAFKGFQSLNSIGRILWKNSNQISEIMGKPTRRLKEFWVPPKNLARGDTAFLVTDAGELFTIVHGRSPGEVLSNANRIKSEAGRELKFVSRKDMGRYFDLQDEVLERMFDFTEISLQTGKAKGTSVNPAVVEVGEAVFNDSIATLEKGFESILRRSRAAFFEPQVKTAYRMYAASGLDALGTRGQSIYQRYLAEIFDNPQLNPNEIIGKAYYGAESIYDDFLQLMFDKLAIPARGERQIVTSRKQNKLYDQLDTQLGEFNPFQNALDFANRTIKQPMPIKMKQQMAYLNKVTSLLTLRLFEVGHSVLTLTSLGATLPAVVKGMSMTSIERGLGEEGKRQFASRIGLHGFRLTEDTASWSPTKAIMTTMHDWYNDKAFREAMGRGGEQGFFDQQVSEIFRTLTAPSEGYVEGLIRRKTDMFSVLSDKSEKLARGLSFAVGYNYAKKVFNIESESVLFSFAHHFANQVIGDYSPNNKPKMFQGAVGMPLGLFTTFMWNYYQRLFGYIENKQLGAAVIQYATQAGVFGAQTVPGWDLYMNTFLTNYDGTVNPVDGLTNTFGPEPTEWFLYGAISNLPKVLGLDDGIALYTRGDVNFRNIPTIFTMKDAPVFSMLADGLRGARETFKQIRERGSLSPYQFSEIVQSYSTNRFLRGISTFVTGAVTDRRGQVIASSPTIGDLMEGDARDFFKAFTRLAGFRTLSESQTVEAQFKIRSGEQSRRYRLDALRDTVRSDIRANKFGQESLERAVSSYIRYGGSPDYFAEWLAGQFIASSVDKNARVVMELFNNPRRSGDVQRLLNIMVPGEYE